MASRTRLTPGQVAASCSHIQVPVWPSTII